MRSSFELFAPGGVAVAAAILAAGAGATAARADVDVEIRAGDRVEGTLSPAAEAETFRIFLAAGAKLTVTAKSRKEKGASTAPVPTFAVLDPDGADLAAGALVPNAKGAALKGRVVAKTGLHRIVVTGNGTAGGYSITTAAKTPTAVTTTGTLGGQAVEVPFSAEQGALLSATVKPAGASAAKPRAAILRNAADEIVHTFPLPSAADTGHTIRRFPVPSSGAFRLIVSDSGGQGGAFSAALKLAGPAPAKRTIRVAAAQIDPAGAAGSATGAVAGPAGAQIDASSVAGLDGAALDVPPGALKKRTAIYVGTTRAITIADRTAIGPAVHFGPEGTKFLVPATITLPMNASLLGGDTAKLAVYTRDAKGRVSQVGGLVPNLNAGTVSFSATHFSSYGAYLIGPPPALPEISADLNDDGLDDLVIRAPQAGGLDRGHVVIFFGGSLTTDTTSASASRRIVGEGNFDDFGSAVATGDLNADGIADLIVGAPGFGDDEGKVYVFHGGSTFTPSAATQAQVTFTGAVADQRYGAAVAAGDLNGDGIHDLAAGTSHDGTEPGSVFVHFGRSDLTSGSSTGASATFTGTESSALFGLGLAIEDVTNDAQRDLLVTAFRGGTAGDGRAYVFRGGSQFASAAASNADAVVAPHSGASLGLHLAAGDVNGDGRADLALTGSSGTSQTNGVVFVMLGFSGVGSHTTADALLIGGGNSAEQTGSDVALADVDGDGDDEVITTDGSDDSLANGGGAVHLIGVGTRIAPGVTLNRTKSAERFVSVLMSDLLRPIDVNGDGIRDVIFGAPRLDRGGNNAGAVRIVTTGILPTRAEDASIEILGSSNDEWLGGR